MTQVPYVHIGVLVDDLEAAIARYERALDVTFMAPLTVHCDRVVEGGRETELDLTIAFSHQGPPYWELLQAVGDGIYGPQHLGGLHHVAVLDADPGRRRDDLLARGFREVAAQERPDGSVIVTYVDPAQLDGVRIEVLDSAQHEVIMGWIATDRARSA